MIVKLKKRIFGYEVADLLIKVSPKEEYLKELCEGKIYMNESGYFRKLEDNYRGDRFDGKCPVNLGKTQTDSLTIFNPLKPEERVEIPAEVITDFALGFSGDDKIPLFCCTQVDEKILNKKTDTQWSFKEEFISEMEQFGEFYILFYKVELLIGLDKHAREIGATIVADKVSYLDILDAYDLNLIDSPDRNYLSPFFQKDTTYQWQNEWRITMLREPSLIGTFENHYVASTTPFTLYHIGKVKDLRSVEIGVYEK